MYQDYFALKELPFAITPDPRFLYMSHRHKEALAHLVYGLKRYDGREVVTYEHRHDDLAEWISFPFSQHPKCISTGQYFHWPVACHRARRRLS